MRPEPVTVLVTAIGGAGYGEQILKAAEFLRRHGFHCPRTTTVSHGDELMGVDWLPLVVKPYLGGGGSRNCYIAQTRRSFSANWSGG